jgi:hypothetical protein
MISRVFVDDFMNGLAHPPQLQPSTDAQKLWIARSVLHAIHAVFPPPDVLHHEGGRDSISKKKLLKQDALWKLEEILLGFSFIGKA